MVPAAQATHAVAPMDEATRGLLQDKHDKEPGELEKVPRAQCVQLLEELEEKLPAGQTSHSWFTFEAVPALQATHDELPAKETCPAAQGVQALEPREE